MQEKPTERTNEAAEDNPRKEAARWRLKRQAEGCRDIKQKKRSKRRSKHIFEVAKGSPTGRERERCNG